MAEKNRYTESGKLIQNTTIKVRLYPTEAQAALCEKTFGCCRYLWNQMLADEQEFFFAAGVHFIPTPARYKKGAPFLKEVISQALINVHQNLRQAFQRFFEQPDKFGYPQFKRKKSGRDAFKIYCQYYPSGSGADVYLTKDGIRLPKLGIVRAKLHRKPLHWWKLKCVTVSRSPSGKYDCSILFEYAVKEADPLSPSPEKAVGLSYSLSHFYIASDGSSPDPPHWLRQSTEKLSRMQRRLSRMKRGSNNYQRQLHKLQILHEHIANQRKDFIHKESRRIANAWDIVGVRGDDLRELSRHLGGAVDEGFGMFRVCLEYKLSRLGKRYITIDRYVPTAKTCHICGHVNEELTAADRAWSCPRCGTALSREINAAKNIRAQALAQLCA